MKRVKRHLILSVAGFCMMAGALLFDQFSLRPVEQIAKDASKRLSEKERVCKQALAELLKNDPSSGWEQLDTYYDEERVGLYLWNKDSLVFWNNAQIPLKYDSLQFNKEEGFAKLPQGYYLYFKESLQSKTALAICLLKPDYELQNNYLKNDFRNWTDIPVGIKLDAADISGYTVLLDDRPVFSIKGSDEKYPDPNKERIFFLIFLAGFTLLLLAALFYTRETHNAWGTVLWIIVIVALRLIMIKWRWPVFFYRTDLYDLQQFGNAQSFFDGYLGDILINAISLLFIASAFHFYNTATSEKRQTLAYSLLLFPVVFFVFNQFDRVAVSLINNSTLSFNFLNIFNLKSSVFIAMVSLGLYALALFILVNRSLSLFDVKTWKGTIRYLLLYLCLCIIQQVCSPGSELIENYWLLIYAGAMLLLRRFYGVRIALALGLQILLISLVTSKIFDTYIDKSKQKDLEILSQKLSEKQDPILENEFSGIPSKMITDEPLNTMLTFVSDIPTAGKEAVVLLKQKYFSGYFDRYNIQFSLFDQNCTPLLEVKDPVLLNAGFFEEQIRENSDSTFVDGLFLVRKYKKNVQYIGKVKLKNKMLYIMMEPKQFEELGSFPDLLLDQSQQKPEKLKGFSHAVYRSKQITSRFGDFNYPFSLQDPSVLALSDPDFIHHYYQPDQDTEVVISERAKRWDDLFTFNSYLLLFFSLITYVCYIFYSAVYTNHFRSPTLTRRIQTIIILLLLLAMSAVGITSGSLVTRQFRKNNKKQLEEKTQIILNELSGQFSADQFFDDAQKELINLKLKEYSRLFNTPISLFYKNGALCNTSEPKLYDLGLAASLVNPKAFWKLKSSESSSEIVTDRAGTLKYLSLYTPVFDKQSELAGFINLPYFARQSDLVNELSGMISALINVYVILFVISILAGLILSGFITQPLRLIKQQLSNVSLGKQNEKISWQSNDEIGKLVFEYNQMLVKLEHSANLLAQSERESAWREMAKQVAHEIKNPLTPMKLNLQYLQHLMKNNPGDFREKFERTSAGIIEQIDSLANIANEFSHFAKLPGTQLEDINLSEVITSSVQVFGNEETVKIVNHIQQAELWVKGDRDQCLRVFNNVLKNAIQALEGIQNPLISIGCELKKESVIVSIADNGCGIDEALKSKIFTPNFTTKTTGSGLGLAMVKNIMMGFEGSIFFTSQTGKGTTFFLEFKRSVKRS